MNYTCEVIIDKPRDEVIQLFDNPKNLQYWQKGFISFEHISGEPGKPGSESIIKYDMNGRKVDMIETITFRHLPDEFHSNYLANGVTNIQKNYFEDLDGKTRWKSTAEFKFTGFMRILAFFMGKKAFQKQSMQFMEDFKAYAEGKPKYGKTS